MESYKEMNEIKKLPLFLEFCYIFLFWLVQPLGIFFPIWIFWCIVFDDSKYDLDGIPDIVCNAVLKKEARFYDWRGRRTKETNFVNYPKWMMWRQCSPITPP